MTKKESKKLIYTLGGSINLDQEKVLYKGKRLTEARAAKLGEETAKKFRGRPSLSNKKEESPIVQFRVTKAKKIAIKKRAKAEKISESELLRRAVDLVLAKK